MANIISTTIDFSLKKDVLGKLKTDFHILGGVVDKLKVKFGGLENAWDKLGNSSVADRVSNLKAGFEALGGITAKVKAGFEQAYGFVESYAATGDRIAKTSRLLGMSAKEYQAFSSAASHAGMATAEMDAALRKLAVNVGKARAGDATAKKMFSALLPKDLSAYKTNAELISALSDSYAKLSNAEQRAFVSNSLFGESGLKMSELLSGGGEGIRKLLDDFEAHGGGFSEEGARNAEAFNDELQNMKETFDSLRVSVAQELFPVFTEMFGKVGEVIRENGPKIKELLTGLAGIVAGIASALSKILDVVVKIFDFLGPFVVVIAGILGVMGSIFGAVVSLVAPVAVLVASFGGILASLAPVAAALAPILAIIVAIVAGVVAWVSVVKEIYDNWDMLCSFIVDDVWGAIKDVGGALYSLFIEPFVNFFKVLPGAVSDLVDQFFVGISRIAEMISRLASGIYDAIVGAVRGAWDSVKSFMSSLPVVGGLFDGEPAESVSSGAAGNLSAGVGKMVESSSSTTTHRFAVDFTGMPKGVTVTPPDSGDFDWSRGYTLAGGV